VFFHRDKNILNVRNNWDANSSKQVAMDELGYLAHPFSCTERRQRCVYNRYVHHECVSAAIDSLTEGGATSRLTDRGRSSKQASRQSKSKERPSNTSVPYVVHCQCVRIVLLTSSE